MTAQFGRYLALSGGVGGAKLALGLSRSLGADELTVLVNTGDDFEHFGLRICPDLDSLTYALSGLSNQTVGWGQKDETWQCLDALGRLGGEDWFRLGDRDLATHILRSEWLRAGQNLTEVTAKLCAALELRAGFAFAAVVLEAVVLEVAFLEAVFFEEVDFLAALSVLA